MTKNEFTCPVCHSKFAFKPQDAEGPQAQYCPFCRNSLDPDKTITIHADSQKDTPFSSISSVSILTEHIPPAEMVKFSIGPYQVMQSIGKGGMGEVFLAYDTTCGRRLALKQIRPDLIEHKQLHNRFLKEARITSQLTHPAIIPIYAIHSESELIYYTMPYVEGKTLKQILKSARIKEKKGKKVDHLAESIPALIRIFLSICQAVAYAHSKSVLHRDLKPENIIVGQYGQIVILDWGLAKLIKNGDEKTTNKDLDALEEEEDENPLHHLTHVGKVVGTISYMAPERALGHPANFQTDIYSLGVILYQLLTLMHPFHRESLKDFRQHMHLEKVIDPTEVAPYRDVPRSLSRVVMKCLAPNPENRYKSVDELIHDLENYIEGRSEWFQIAELDINNKSDWEFQENVLIAEHVALAREMESSDWVCLMISKASFQNNLKLEATIKIGEAGHGLGFLLSIPEAAERTHLNDGYCLWLGTDINKTTKLLRSTVEVMQTPEIFLNRNEWYHIRIEKVENNIYFYLNNTLQFTYISHLPLAGTHIGLISRDADFTLKDFQVFIGSQNVTVNCLAVPDAFLAHKDYNVALTEYRRIGYSFPGRAEGREAMFRAGITLLEQAKDTDDKEKKTALFDFALEEFNKLQNTPGAPLEYLGKALVYEALGDYEEEAKCFELAYRRYPKHPLLPMLQEQIVYRMHDSSRHHRQATFHFILLTLRYLKEEAANANTKKLLTSLDRHWEPLFFIENDPDYALIPELGNLIYSLKLAFWLARPYVLAEIIDELLKMKKPHPITVANAIYCLVEIGNWELAEEKLKEVIQHNANNPPISIDSIKETLEITSLPLEKAIETFLALPSETSHSRERLLFFLMEKALDTQNSMWVHNLFQHAQKTGLSHDAQIEANGYEIWALLLDKNIAKSGELLHQYPIELLSQETTILHFLYGCWLYLTEGKEIAYIHFAGIFESAYPRSWSLFSYYIKANVTDDLAWTSKLFLWEKRQLFRQLSLFYHCVGDIEKSRYYQHLIV